MGNLDLKALLTDFCGASGVSGEEADIALVCKERLAKYGKAEYDMKTGNVCFKSENFDMEKPTVLLNAHIDEIGMIVNYITDDGFLRVSACGGIDERVLPAAQVTVLGKEKLRGVITSVPPHLQTEHKKAASLNDLYVDIGMSGESAKKSVSLGDRVLIENKLETLRGTQVTSKALDDRAGAAAIILALEMTNDKNLRCNTAVLFSSKEETGSQGAKSGAYELNADFAIVVDVSFAKTHSESPEDCGELGKGAMIGISPTLSKKMSHDMIELAQKNGIPYQIEVMSGKTGTDADSIGISRGGIPSVTLSIPEKHMHTPVEIVDLNDIENTAKLIAAYLESVYGVI